MSEIPDESAQAPDTGEPQGYSQPSMAGDIIRLASGTMFAQLIGVIVSPILARIFTPSDYGNYQVFNSIFYILVILVSLRYESAIVLPNDDSDAVNLLALSSLLSFIFSVFSVPFFALFGKWLTITLGAPDIYPFLWAISVNLLLMGLFNAANYWNTRTRKFGRLAFARFNNSTGSSFAQLGAGWSGWLNVGGLIGGTLIGSFISTAILVGRCCAVAIPLNVGRHHWQRRNHNAQPSHYMYY